MLSDKEVEQSTHELRQFRDIHSRHQEDVSQLLEKYSLLIEDYQRLKSDFEEARDSRERYKQLVKTQDRDPFVLVLVDGDNYIFDNDLVAGGGEGGQRAAQVLNNAVKRSLGDRGLGHCRIMVRIYANLAGLSKALSRLKLCGPEKRSLASFTANFTRSMELFDFVDSGELKENADYKIRAMFSLFVHQPQCRHIYFAGCHDVGYINELTPHASSRDRITLVRSYALHPEFTKLNLRIEEFPGVFRATPLSGEPHIPRSASESMPARSTASNGQVNPEISTSSEQGPLMCRFFSKGLCKYGNKCVHLHAQSSRPYNDGQFPQTSSNTRSPDVRDWRGKDVVTPNSHSGLPHLNRLHQETDFANVLPHEDSVPQGCIPVNHAQRRIDTYLPPPSKDAIFAFNERIAVQKLCNNHHLRGYCGNGDACTFDHNSITPDILAMLKTVARSAPCPRKGLCRDLSCFQGHICQRSDCKHRGGKAFCKIGYLAHLERQDLYAIDYVEGHSAKGFSTEDSEMMPSVSGKDSSSYPGAGSDGRSSEAGEEPVAGDGAWLGDVEEGASLD